ncbi:MAG: DUF4956 domain-containing protein [Lactobacillaceae bacterium]|jgi:hypothetical protein|nr:DUF4956 domain-containing protein [Lactobacillaceae bacterium]
MLNSIFTTTSDGSATLTASSFILAAVTALVLGIVAAAVYLKTYKSRTSPQTFAITLIVLPVVIAVIIMLVGNNVARAFSLAGAFSIIRFRSAPGDPQEITYVLYTMAIGLAAGMGYLAYAGIAAVLILAVLFVLNSTNFGGTTVADQILKITVPEDMYFKNEIEDTLNQFTSKWTLKKIKTTELGSLFEINYLIRLKQDANEKQFIDALRTLNGNLTIAMQYNLLADEY